MEFDNVKKVMFGAVPEDQYNYNIHYTFKGELKDPSTNKMVDVSWNLNSLLSEDTGDIVFHNSHSVQFNKIVCNQVLMWSSVVYDLETALKITDSLKADIKSNIHNPYTQSTEPQIYPNRGIEHTNTGFRGLVFNINEISTINNGNVWLNLYSSITPDNATGDNIWTAYRGANLFATMDFTDYPDDEYDAVWGFSLTTGPENAQVFPEWNIDVFKNIAPSAFNNGVVLSICYYDSAVPPGYSGIAYDISDDPITIEMPPIYEADPTNQECFKIIQNNQTVYSKPRDLGVYDEYGLIYELANDPLRHPYVSVLTEKPIKLANNEVLSPILFLDLITYNKPYKFVTARIHNIDFAEIKNDLTYSSIHDYWSILKNEYFPNIIYSDLSSIFENCNIDGEVTLNYDGGTPYCTYMLKHSNITSLALNNTTGNAILVESLLFTEAYKLKTVIYGVMNPKSDYTPLILLDLYMLFMNCESLTVVPNGMLAIANYIVDMSFAFYNTKNLSHIRISQDNSISPATVIPYNMTAAFLNSGITMCELTISCINLTPATMAQAFRNSKIQFIYLINLSPVRIDASITTYDFTASGIIGDLSLLSLACVTKLLTTLQPVRNSSYVGSMIIPSTWGSVFMQYSQLIRTAGWTVVMRTSTGVVTS